MLNPEYDDEKKILDILVKSGLITGSQADQVIVHKDQTRIRLEGEASRKRKAQGSVITGTNEKVDIIDIIVAMNINSGSSASVIDEDAVYHALAKGWKLPYRKIDPLKLDLNIVTITIPKNFALKHLMLPIEVRNGELTVATPNPFNTEALEDIKRASGMKINPVVSSKSDVIRLIDEFFGFKEDPSLRQKTSLRGLLSISAILNSMSG